MNKKLRNRQGFTLIEMMTVVVVIGIVSVMAFPRFGATIDRLKMKSEMRNIVSKMRLARSEAITSKQNIGVTFDWLESGNGEYTLHVITFLDNVHPHLMEYNWGDSIINSSEIEQSVGYVWADMGWPSVVYRPNGSAGRSDRFRVEAYNYDNGYSDDHTGFISVVGATGKTKLDSLVRHDY